MQKNTTQIDNLKNGALDKNFCMSKMFGRLDLRQMCGNRVKSSVDGKPVSFEPVKQMVNKANIILSQEVIDQLLAAPKYVITEMDVTSSGVTSKHNLQASSAMESAGDNIADTYLAEKIDNDRICESYAKCNSDMHNRGVFYLMSEINGTPQLFAANVLASGHSGKSVSLMYLPKGDMENAILLERVCYHGKQGNEHIGETGDQIGRTDVHIHLTDGTFLDRVINSKLPYSRKIVELNSPTPYCVAKETLPDDANISRMVDYAMDTMHIAGLMPRLELDTAKDMGAAVNDSIDNVLSF